MADADRDECGPVAGRTCVVCGEPAWFNLRAKTEPGLWVCPAHVQSPDWLELSLALRALGRAILAEIRPPLERVLLLSRMLEGK